jgi:uncharacterized protein (TIGR00730 family)
MEIKRICVFCGSSYGHGKEYKKTAVQLGHILVSKKIGLVYGGGDVGLMGTTANTVFDNGGEVIGIIPRHLADQEVAHNGISDLRIVNSMHERKALMETLSDAFIAMPGGFGTIEEIFEAITWAQLKLHSKPCGFLNISGFFDKLFDFINTVSTEGFIKKEYLNIMQIDSCPEKLFKKMDCYQPIKIDKATCAIEEKFTHQRHCRKRMKNLKRQ